MFFIGIDIGKRNHEIALINDRGDTVGSTLRITNSKSGSEKLLNFINQHHLDASNTMIGMEATGHYWLSIYSFLSKLDFHVCVFNPLQSDALRKFYIRKTKTDSIDAILVAQVIRLDMPQATNLPQEDVFKLKRLERFRYGLVDESSDLKRKIIACLDQVFPEYEKFFSDIFGRSSTEVLLQSPLPEDILEIDTDLLGQVINDASNKRLGLTRSLNKVQLLKESAAQSFGISVASDVFKLQIQLMLEQIKLIESHIQIVDEEMAVLVQRQNTFLTTITGIGPVTAATIIGEVGHISRFEKPSQLLAFAGMYATVHQSGDFLASQAKMSKRGSPYLRRAIWQAAFIASNKDPALSAYYQKLRARGKSHGTAIGAVSRKLVNIIFAVWSNNKPYVVHLPQHDSNS
jgi:transposase